MFSNHRSCTEYADLLLLEGWERFGERLVVLVQGMLGKTSKVELVCLAWKRCSPSLLPASIVASDLRRCLGRLEEGGFAHLALDVFRSLVLQRRVPVC